MSTRTASAPEPEPPTRGSETARSPDPGDAEAGTAEASAWVPDGLVAGVIGAALIAVFFLGVDLVEGRGAFWTPGALGSALFLGEPLAASETPQPVIVIGYTVLHGSVFAIAGMLGSFLLLGNRSRLGPASGLVMAVALFAGFEIVFLGLERLAPGLSGAFSASRVAMANVLAAAAMAAALLRPPLQRLSRQEARPRDAG